eukprot:558898-Hanusia_phi.AAC.4
MVPSSGRLTNELCWTSAGQQPSRLLTPSASRASHAACTSSTRKPMCPKPLRSACPRQLPPAPASSHLVAAEVSEGLVALGAVIVRELEDGAEERLDELTR